MNDAMAQADRVQQAAEQVAASLPVWLDVVLAFVGLWGVFLWLFGRRLVRPTVTMLGLVAGGLSAGLIARQFTEGAALAGWALGGGVAGGLVVWVTFRVWIGLALAIVLGSAAPWAVLAWEGADWPIEAGQSIREAAEGAIEEGRQRILDNGEADGAGDEAAKERGHGKGGDEGGDEGDGEATVLAKLEALARQVAGDLRQWWGEELDPAVRWSVMAASAIVAAGGLMIGLVLPNLGASLAASLVGSVLIGGVTLRLSGRYLEGVYDWLPSSPRRALIALAVMTVIGTLIQWTLTGRRTDK